MPVGTRGTVKALGPDELRGGGRADRARQHVPPVPAPGHELIRDLGGLHRFMGWDGPILTDSGGFQVLSLAEAADASRRRASRSARPWTARSRCSRPSWRSRSSTRSAPTSSIRSTSASRIPRHARQTERSLALTLRWARALAATRTARGGAARRCSASCRAGPTPSCASAAARRDGGAGVRRLRHRRHGGGRAEADDVRPDRVVTAASLPADRPRYLMGVGKPEDLVEAVARGVDMFDCVLPTRNARNGQCFTADGPVDDQAGALRARPRRRSTPAVAATRAGRFSRAYLRHLFMADELLAYRAPVAAQRPLLRRRSWRRCARPSPRALRADSGLGFSHVMQYHPRRFRSSNRLRAWRT